MKQGLSILIQKDKKLVENLWPLKHFLNVDYQMFTSAIVNKLKSGLNQILSETQSVFIKGRLSHNIIYLILDLLDYRLLCIYT